MANDVTGIGYAVFAPTRGTFLGRVGEWYTDIRLAQVYAEPRAARLAANRLKASFATTVIEVTMTVSGRRIEQAEQDAAGWTPQPANPAPGEAKPKQKEQPAKPGTKAA